MPTAPLDESFLSKVECILPKVEFTVTSQIINDVAKELSDDFDIVKKYVFAVAQKYKK